MEQRNGKEEELERVKKQRLSMEKGNEIGEYML